jgi:serine/threonine protein kinase
VSPIRFGREFELDRQTYVLRRSGQPIKLERIPTEILLLLIERAGELVTREEIVERVWGKDVFVDTDNSINSAIRKIRLVLRDDPEAPQFVQTVIGRGYLFLAAQLTAELDPAPAEISSDKSPEGRRIGDYRILQLLGGGGMGVVYKAEDLNLGRQVAIKFLPRELADDRGALEQMQVEARLVSALNHPHICPIYQLGEQDGLPFIVMPLLEGRTLREWISAEATRPAATCVREVVKLAVQMSDALQFAHEKGIIHRDIKPANIFVTSRGEIKVLDFGVATLRDTPGAGPILARKESGTAKGVTRTGLSPGTPAYLSPEEVRGETLDARSDLFSLGSVLYEMTTGNRPFRGDTVLEIEQAILRSEPPSIRELKSGVPARWEEIVMKMLAKDRERRYQSSTELHQDLTAFQAELEPRLSVPQTAELKSGRGNRRRVYTIAGAIVAGIMLASFALLRHSPGTQPFREFSITQITNNGRAEQAAISPDGKYVAHVNDDNGQKSIRLRNISTGSDTQIFPPTPTRFRSLVFSPDGNYLYFRQLINSIGTEWDGFRIPVLGGKPERLIRDIDSSIIFSPDGKHISYVRANDPEEGKYRVLSSNLDGSAETVITIQKIEGFGHESYPPFGAWSPDGKQVAYTFAKMADEPGIVRVLDVTSKRLGVLQHFPDLLTFDIDWSPNQNWLLLVHSPKQGGEGPAQISAFSLAERKLYPITRDTNSYSSLTVSSDGKVAAAVQTKTVSSVDFHPPLALNDGITRSHLDNTVSFDWDSHGKLIYSDGSKLWRLDPGNGAKVQLNADTTGNIVGLAQCSTGTILVNWEYHLGTQGSEIWRLNSDGSNEVRLSDGRYDMSPACSPDGRWAYYLDSMQVLKRVPVAGGKAETVPVPVPNLDRILGTVAFSPDGASLVVLVDAVDPVSERAEPHLVIFDVSGDRPVLARLLDPVAQIVAGSLHGGGVRFSPDGKSLVYATKEKGVGNVWEQPLDGSPGHAITQYNSDLVVQFRFSPDGKTLAVRREHTTSDIVVLRSAGAN